MKKSSFAMLIFAILCLCFLYVNKLYYPPHPIESISKKQLYTAGSNADKTLQFVTNSNNVDWYITKSRNDINQILQQFVEQQGWEFIMQDGSGYFFEKDEETIIITTEMWSSKFKLVKIPSQLFQ